LVKHGLAQTSIDAEVRSLLLAASDIKEHDEGVYSVLLAAAHARIEEMQAEGGGHQRIR
jgi:hypothetical protein